MRAVHTSHSQCMAFLFAASGLQVMPLQKFDASLMSSHKPSKGTWSCMYFSWRCSQLVTLGLDR